MRRRFWIEAGLAAASAFLLLLTLVTTGMDRGDLRRRARRRNGSLEWLIVAALLATTLTVGLLARAEWMRRRPRTDATTQFTGRDR